MPQDGDKALFLLLNKTMAQKWISANQFNIVACHQNGTKTFSYKLRIRPPKNLLFFEWWNASSQLFLNCMCSCSVNMYLENTSNLDLEMSQASAPVHQAAGNFGELRLLQGISERLETQKLQQQSAGLPTGQCVIHAEAFLPVRQEDGWGTDGWKDFRVLWDFWVTSGMTMVKNGAALQMCSLGNLLELKWKQNKSS